MKNTERMARCSMTREMNKPDWCGYDRLCGDFVQAKWLNYNTDCCKKCEYNKQQRILNPDIAEFFWNCCKMERLEK